MDATGFLHPMKTTTTESKGHRIQLQSIRIDGIILLAIALTLKSFLRIFKVNGLLLPALNMTPKLSNSKRVR